MAEVTIHEMTVEYHRQLLSDPERVDYYHSRGINDQTIARHQLGWIIDPINSNHDPYKGLPVVPYLSAMGTTVLLRASPFESDLMGRHDLIAVEHAPAIRGQELHLFNPGNAMPGLRSSKVHLVNDVESVLVLRSKGERAVGVPGWKNWQEAWVHLFLHSEVLLYHQEGDTEHIESLVRQFRRHRIPHTLMMLPPKGTAAEEYRNATSD